jgi:outer membrane protein assembly factor BamE
MAQTDSRLHLCVGRGAIPSHMRKFLLITLLALALPLAGGCVYQPSLSQGNLLKQEDIDQLEVGMTRGQVRFLLGTPMIDDPFHEERWDYVYYLRIGRQDPRFTRWVTIIFDGDTVAEIRKDQKLEPEV